MLGRIHLAVISGINHETSAITVEWFEKGETKGKEIDFEQLLDLNPALSCTDAVVLEAENETAPQRTNQRERLLSEDDKLKKKVSKNIALSIHFSVFYVTYKTFFRF